MKTILCDEDKKKVSEKSTPRLPLALKEVFGILLEKMDLKGRTTITRF
jgi:hypothetical protein